MCLPNSIYTKLAFQQNRVKARWLKSRLTDLTGEVHRSGEVVDLPGKWSYFSDCSFASFGYASIRRKWRDYVTCEPMALNLPPKNRRASSKVPNCATTAICGSGSFNSSSLLPGPWATAISRAARGLLLRTKSL